MPTHRVVFMGTPSFALPSLRYLAGRDDVEIPLVVTQPDRKAGRGRSLQSPPVKQLADELTLPVVQTATLRDRDLRAQITASKPDLIVVAAFGLLLGKWVLDLPRVACVNLHASLLPNYRGASPVAAAILNGDDRTGLSLMRMEATLDTGPVYATVEVPISSTDTTDVLTNSLADASARLLDKHLSLLLAGDLPTHQQALESVSLTRPLGKSDGQVDWSQPAAQIERHVRAMWPWPRAWTSLPNGSTFQIHLASVQPVNDGEASAPGSVSIDEGQLRIATGDGILVIERGLLPGGKPLDGSQLAQHPAWKDVERLDPSESDLQREPFVIAHHRG